MSRGVRFTYTLTVRPTRGAGDCAEGCGEPATHAVSLRDDSGAGCSWHTFTCALHASAGEAGLLERAAATRRELSELINEVDS